MGNDIFDKLKKNKKTAEKSINNKEDVNSNVDVNVNSNSYVTISKNNDKGKVKRTYYLEPETEKELSRLARKTGRIKSDIVEFALRHYFEVVKIEE